MHTGPLSSSTDVFVCWQLLDTWSKRFIASLVRLLLV